MFERELRDLSFVPRWSIARVLNRQTLDQHHFFVGVYALKIAEHLNLSDGQKLALAKLALYHDWKELISGDTPGPVKHHMHDEDKSSMFLSSEMRKRFKNGPYGGGFIMDKMDPVVYAVMKLADMLDGAFYLLTEMQMGNKAVERLYVDQHEVMRQKLTDLELVWGSPLHDLRIAIDEDVKTHRYDQSKIVAGAVAPF